MALHVCLGQFDTDGETLHDQNHSGTLKGDLIRIAPGDWVEDISGVRPKDDAAYGCDGGLTDVHLLLDEQGAQHKQASETSEDKVGQMWLVD